MLIRWLSGGGDVHQRRIIAHTSWSGGIRMFFCISTSRNTIVLDERWAFSIFTSCIMMWPASDRLNTDQPWHDSVGEEKNLSSALFQTSCIWNGVGILRSECNLSLRERDFFVLVYCNTQSYCIRERLVSLSYFWISIKVTPFLIFSYVWNSFFFCIENQTRRSDYPWFARSVIFNLATQSWRIPFKKFKTHKKIKKVSLLLIFKHMKVIQDALLYK